MSLLVSVYCRTNHLVKIRKVLQGCGDKQPVEERVVNGWAKKRARKENWAEGYWKKETEEDEEEEEKLNWTVSCILLFCLVCS